MLSFFVNLANFLVRWERVGIRLKHNIDVHLCGFQNIIKLHFIRKIAHNVLLGKRMTVLSVVRRNRK